MLDLAPQLADRRHHPRRAGRSTSAPGALALVRAVQYLPEGVVLAVVDPGVGTDRRCIAVEVEHGCFVGPDNGLLAPAVAMLGGPQRSRRARRTREYQLPAPGPTFAGRDVMAPAAAHLANGVDLLALGDEVDPASLAPGILPLPERRGRRRSTARCCGSIGSATASSTSTPRSLRRARRRRRATRSRCAWATRADGPAGCTRSPTPSRQSSC